MNNIIIFELIFLNPIYTEIIKRQNAYLNVTSYLDNYKQSLLLFDSILFGFNSPTDTKYGLLIKAISFNTTNSKQNNYGCSNYINKNLFNLSYIGLVSRGECSFETKIRIATENKASALIVYNTDDSAFIMYSNSIYNIYIFFVFNFFTKI